METREFGARLRQLRKQACITQRELADKVDVNFTYLSKIESGVVGSPSKSVILKLAEVLNADKDQLLVLAGKVPSDVAEMLLKNGKTLQLIRSRSVHKIFKASSRIGTGLQNFTRSLKNSTNGAGLFLKNHKGLSRAAMAVAIVLAIVGSLWFTTAVKAVELTLPDLPTSMYTNRSYSFYAQVDILTNEAIPITKLRLDITGPTDAWVEFSVDGTIISQSNHFTSIQQVVSPYYGEGYGYGYGYGYDPSTGYGFITWGSYGYTDYGYGYGYGYSTGLPTQAKYLVILNTSGMSTGSYEAQLACYVTPAPTRFLSSKSSFTMSTRRYSEPPAAPAVGVAVEPGVTDVSDVVTSEGVFTQDVTCESEDGKVELFIDEYTIGLTEEGEPLSEISIIPMEDPPAPPADASIIGLTYDLGPDGATFDPSITLTFTYDPDEVPTGVNLVIAIWDGEKWVELEGCIVDPVTHTITASVSHFTPFTILASLPVEEEVVVAPPPVEEEEVVVVVPPPVEEEEVVPEEEEEIVVPEEEEVVPAAGILWWVWVIIAAVVVIGGLLAYFLWWRRRTA